MGGWCVCGWDERHAYTYTNISNHHKTTQQQPEFLFVQLPKRLPGLVAPDGTDAAALASTATGIDDPDGPPHPPPAPAVKTETGIAAASSDSLPPQQQQATAAANGTAPPPAPAPPLRPQRVNPLARAGSGYLGRIRVHASGRMTFVAGACVGV